MTAELGMHLRNIRLVNIKCFEDVTVRFPTGQGENGGWCVLLGGNGMGKSTLLQAIAIALIGPIAGQRLLHTPGTWVRQGAPNGTFEASIVKGDSDSAAGKPRVKPYEARYAVTSLDEVKIDGRSYDQPQLALLTKEPGQTSLRSGPYSAKRSGWFSCGYGPFRRLLGGAENASSLMFSQGRESRFVTLFLESAALTQCTDWLPNLYGRSIDPGNPEQERAGRMLKAARALVDDLLPGSVRIDRIDTKGVTFRSVGGAAVNVLELSDGYRSFLSLALDVLRQLDSSIEDITSLIQDRDGHPCVASEGVILIDEVDAHLHPFWQREIGFRLRRTFPRMQFIVTSHSPFVAQAATDGGLIVLQSGEAGDVVHAQTPIESVKGWRVDQILTSPLFGLTATRDEGTEALIRDHATLVAKRTWAQLSSAEQSSLAKLEQQLTDRLTAPGETKPERDQREKMDSYIEETLAGLGGQK